MAHEPVSGAAPNQPSVQTRSLPFSERTHRRYWWHWGQTRRFIPDVYGCLRQDEWEIIRAWYEETEQRELMGEMAVPMISVLRGFLMSGGASAIVQLGHYCGYSTLLLGFALRRMRRRRALFSIDIDERCTEFTRSWVERAGLNDQVELHVGDSADPASAEAAVRYLGRPPQIVIVDSSHEFAHTGRELALWYDRLPPGGMMFLHDSSEYAETFDRTRAGGVRRALLEWLPRLPAGSAILIAGDADPAGDAGTPYADGCGLAIIQKPASRREPIPTPR